MQHVHDLTTFDATLLTAAETGGDAAYDQSYWGARNPVQYIPAIVRDGIPAFLVGGWYDLFQRGELLNYSSFQNAFNHRPVLAPMSAAEPVTPRYQLIQGPWYHVTAGMGLNYHGLDLNGVELAWFDHWLKGVDTGITDTTTPLHLEDLGKGNYVDAARYPVNQAVPHAYYFGGGGSLGPRAPNRPSSADSLVFTGTEIPCTTSTEQWAAGLGMLALSYFGIKDPCTQSSTPSQLGPGTRSYTTAPFRQPTTLAGPIGATLYGTSTTPDTEWVVQLSDVAPNGSALPLTSGLLEGRQRAVNASMTWSAPDGMPLLPYHPYTKAAGRTVPPGKVTRYDIEVFPTFATLRTGHRLRVTIATSDFPHVLPSATQALGLIGGVYGLEHSKAYPSSIELPLVPAQSSLPPVGRTPLGCPAASGGLSAAQLGRVRLGATRRATRAAFVASSARGRRYTDWFCLAGGEIRAGYATPRLLRSVSAAERHRVRGRVVLALTANRHYSARGVRPGNRLSSARRHLRLGRGFVVGRNTWYLTSVRGARVVLKVHKGVVQELGIANRRLTTGRKAARRFLTSFY
jgi:putative CocE/NonD family hydrolase